MAGFQYYFLLAIQMPFCLPDWGKTSSEKVPLWPPAKRYLIIITIIKQSIQTNENHNRRHRRVHVRKKSRNEKIDDIFSDVSFIVEKRTRNRLFSLSELLVGAESEKIDDICSYA